MKLYDVYMVFLMPVVFFFLVMTGSYFNSGMEKDHWQFSSSDNNDNGNTLEVYKYVR